MPIHIVPIASSSGSKPGRCLLMSILAARATITTAIGATRFIQNRGEEMGYPPGINHHHATAAVAWAVSNAVQKSTTTLEIGLVCVMPVAW
jgi:hypothetical protein